MWFCFNVSGANFTFWNHSIPTPLGLCGYASVQHIAWSWYPFSYFYQRKESLHALLAYGLLYHRSGLQNIHVTNRLSCANHNFFDDCVHAVQSVAASAVISFDVYSFLWTCCTINKQEKCRGCGTISEIYKREARKRNHRWRLSVVRRRRSFRPQRIFIELLTNWLSGWVMGVGNISADGRTQEGIAVECRVRLASRSSHSLSVAD